MADRLRGRCQDLCGKWTAKALKGLMLASCIGGLRAAHAAAADIPINGSRVFPESISADLDGNIYIGSVSGTVYRVESEGKTAEPWIVPGPENGLTSLFGVLADENRGLLWVCNNPPFGGPPPPGAKSGLKSFDLQSGELTGTYDFPGEGPFACNDITIRNLADLYVTDTSGGRIFHLAPDAEKLELFAQDPELVGVDGIAVSGDGTIYINNVRTGAFYRVAMDKAGKPGKVTQLETSRPLVSPDGMRPMGGLNFALAEGQGGHVSRLTVKGDKVEVTNLAENISSPTGVDLFKGTVWYVQGHVGALFNPSAPQPALPFRLTPVPPR